MTDPNTLKNEPRLVSSTPDSLARRSMLLKGVVKGGGVLAVAAGPAQVLATGSLTVLTHDRKRCSISGMQSGAYSGPQTTVTCQGYSPGKYKKIENWPNYSVLTKLAVNTVGSLTFDQKEKFNVIFGGGSSSGLLYIMQNMANTNEYHWITALLNAIGGAPASFYFPFNGMEVIQLYKGSKSAEALKFFKDYMEKHTG